MNLEDLIVSTISDAKPMMILRFALLCFSSLWRAS